VALHGDLDQSERTEVLVRFANRSATVLIATDVAARGLDVKDLDAVFNYELPKQAEIYVHRIGRTGRAGKQGVAVSLVEEREEWRWQDIEKLLPDAFPKKCGIPDTKRSADTLTPAMTTIHINGGRKNKLRPGDLLGALTADGGVPGDSVGSIDLFDTRSYVAIRKKSFAAAGESANQGQKVSGSGQRVRFQRCVNLIAFSRSESVRPWPPIYSRTVRYLALGV
jgi:ATP-independent RNA helicase DbpA